MACCVHEYSLGVTFRITMKLIGRNIDGLSWIRASLAAWFDAKSSRHVNMLMMDVHNAVCRQLA